MKYVVHCRFDCVVEADSEDEAIDDLISDINLHFDDVEEITLYKIGRLDEEGEFIEERD